MISITMLDRDNGCEHLRYFEFPLDGGKTFDYNARRSYNAFFNHNFTRNQNGSIMFCQNQRWESEIDYKDFPNLLVTRLNSLYEFYRVIGYDYKTHQYVDLHRR